jgi:hypothetical protein
MLAPTLGELEQTRSETIHKVKLRAILFIPLGVMAGLAFSALPNHGQATSIVGYLVHAGIGAGLGFGWAASKPANAYRCLYKERVLPQLAALFGKLDYRAAVVPDLAILRSEDVLPAYDVTIAEDEIFGQYRDLALNIVELTLRRHGGKTDYTVFDGLLTSIELPRKLIGTTAVVADKPLIGGLSALLGEHRHERVSIEDPVFAKAYVVYGSDQIAARALLTPAFMERFLALGQREGFGRPTALARDNLLTIILPKSGQHDLFEPPSYLTPASAATALVALYDDIAAVLDVADAVIGLDQGARAVASQAAGGPTSTAGTSAASVPPAIDSRP